MLDLSRPELVFALKVVREASRLAKQIQSEMTAQELTKGDRSPVTVADFAVQALVGKALLEAFPKDVLVAEEDAGELKKRKSKDVLAQVMEFVQRFLPDAKDKEVCAWIDRGNGKPEKRFWTLDPIDGTKGFLRGEQYAVGISLVENYQVTLAVIACPNLSANCRPDIGGFGSIAISVKGEGSWISSLNEENQDFKPLHVSTTKDPKKVRMLRSVETEHTHTGRTDAFLEKIQTQEEVIRMDSLAKHVVLAAGNGDAFFYLLPRDNPNYRMKIWDVAPGYLMIREAGGLMTDLEGKDIDFSAGLTVAQNPGLVMTNGHLHPTILQALAEVQTV